MRQNLFLLVCLATAIVFSSCASTRVQNLTKATLEALELVKQEAQRAIRLTEEKVNRQEVDPNIGKEVINNLEATEKKVDDQIVKAAQLEKQNDREAILKFAESSHVIIQSALTDIKSLNDLYDVTTFSQFETATFFPLGGYIIPQEKLDEARVSMEPIVKRIIKFIGDHPNQRFVAVVVCSGHSDETPVSKESPLYKSLLPLMKNPNPTRQELNQKISELRAKSIARLLVDVIKVNEGLIPNPRLINYDIKWLGRGEAYPTTKIKDYTPNDKRRRVVSLIWNVLPGSLYIQGLDTETETD